MSLRSAGVLRVVMLHYFTLLSCLCLWLLKECTYSPTTGIMGIRTGKCWTIMLSYFLWAIFKGVNVLFAFAQVNIVPLLF